MRKDSVWDSVCIGDKGTHAFNLFVANGTLNASIPSSCMSGDGFPEQYTIMLLLCFNTQLRTSDAKHGY